MGREGPMIRPAVSWRAAVAGLRSDIRESPARAVGFRFSAGFGYTAALAAFVHRFR
jgi:hypothetical protein